MGSYKPVQIGNTGKWTLQNIVTNYIYSDVQFKTKEEAIKACSNLNQTKGN